MAPDPKSALERLLAEAPHVRRLATVLVRADADADDLEQQTWLNAVSHGGHGVDEPRGWLSRLVRNAAANLVRGRGRRQRHEAAAGRSTTAPSSAELAEREEQRRRLVAAVDALPDDLRTVVLLRYFEGLEPRAIAQRLGVPVDTIYNRTRSAIQRLRALLDERSGGRAAWLGPIAVLTHDVMAPAPVLPAAAATSPHLWHGVLTVTAKKTTAVLGIALAVASAIVWWQTGDGTPNDADLTPARHTTGTASAPLGRDGTDPRSPAVREPVAAASPASANAPAVADPTTGSLEVTVTLERTQGPAAGIGVLVRRIGADHRIGTTAASTNDNGVARFPRLPARRYLITTEQVSTAVVADVEAGEVATAELTLPLGVRVTGQVVDPNGVPVPRATVEAIAFARTDADPFVIATADSNGRFAVDDLPIRLLIGARAPGWQASRLTFVSSTAGSDADIELRLGAGGGTVEGTVHDPAGEPVAGAFVHVGEDRICAVTATADGADPLGALVRTDGEGRFWAIGVPAGPQRVVVRSPGFAPWRGHCEVAPSGTALTRIVLTAAAGLRGRVIDDDGQPVARAGIEIGSARDLAHFATLTARDGTFEFEGLPAGELAVVVEHDDHGRGTHVVQTVANTTIERDLPITRGHVVSGQVIDHEGNPVAGAYVSGRTRGWSPYTVADDQGRFELINCPPDQRISLTARAEGDRELTRKDLDPRATPFRLQIAAPEARSAVIAGRVLDHRGDAVADADVTAMRRGTPRFYEREKTAADGTFELGPLPSGTFHLSVRARGLAPLRLDPRELLANDRWDLGDIRMPATGRIAIEFDGDPKDVDGRAYLPTGPFAAHFEREHDTLLSHPIAAGKVQVHLTGDGIAAARYDVEVREGETTTVRAKLRPGIAQPLVGQRHRYEVFAGERRIARGYVQDTGSVTLAPGTYRLVAKDPKGRKTSREFAVRGTPGEPIDLR